MALFCKISLRYQLKHLHTRLFSSLRKSPEKRRGFSKLRFALYTFGLSSVGTGTYIATLNRREQRKLKVDIQSGFRFFRSLYNALVIAADYKWSLRNYESDTDEWTTAASVVHQRSAERLLEACLHNGGLYIKLGQGLVSMNHVLPKEYIQTLVVLQDKALHSDVEDVEQLFEEDFGKSPYVLFKEFDKTPLAAASLAQVHKARTHDDEEVAVKIQYIDLRDRYPADMRTIQFLLKIIGIVHTSFGFEWVFKDMKRTLALELDFENEAKNAERCAKDMSGFPFIYVPKIHWDLTTKRVMTAEYINGCKISDLNGIKELKLSLKDIDNKLVKCFAHQVFHTGFVHADPHPGNIFVRRSRHGGAELVLLDHGLYDYLKESQRISLCHLYKAITLSNQQQMQEHSLALGVKVSDYMVFCECLVQRPLHRPALYLPSKMTASEIEYMGNMARKHFDRIMAVLKQMPRPLLLYIRNINTIRAISHIHGHPVDRFAIMAQSALTGAFNSQHSGLVDLWIRLPMIRVAYTYRIKMDAWSRFMYSKIMRYYIYVLHLLGRGPNMEQFDELFTEPPQMHGKANIH